MAEQVRSVPHMRARELSVFERAAPQVEHQLQVRPELACCERLVDLDGDVWPRAGTLSSVPKISPRIAEQSKIGT